MKKGVGGELRLKERRKMGNGERGGEGGSEKGRKGGNEGKEAVEDGASGREWEQKEKWELE